MRARGGFPPIPIVALRLLADAAAREARAIDVRVRAVQAMVPLAEAETVEAFRNVAPADVRATALELARRSSSLFAHALELAFDVAERLEIRAAEFYAEALGRVEAITPDLATYAPSLPPPARTYLRAINYLTAKMASVTPLPPPDGMLELFNALPDEAATFLGLMQGLAVLGVQGGAPAAVLEAMGREAWAFVREGADEDLVEDSYWAARADEAKLEGGEGTSLDELMGRPH